MSFSAYKLPRKTTLPMSLDTQCECGFTCNLFHVTAVLCGDNITKVAAGPTPGVLMVNMIASTGCSYTARATSLNKLCPKDSKVKEAKMTI